jgi:CheW-like domain
MLFLVFQLGTDRYAIEAAQVVEVLPLVNAKHIPRAPRASLACSTTTAQRAPLEAIAISPSRCRVTAYGAQRRCGGVLQFHMRVRGGS